MPAIGIPLTSCADEMISRLAAATGSDTLASLEGATLLGERAMLGRMTVPGRKSAGGGCRLYTTGDDAVALNLSRAADRELLPALFATDLDTENDEEVAHRIARAQATELVVRGRSMGMAIAAESEMQVGRELTDTEPPVACVEIARGPTAVTARSLPRVVDLSALWAGPLAAHLLWLAGAKVVKVESRSRPDSMRTGNNTFYALLNQGKDSVVLDL
jgi:crotonobetainyl-CoA:carnitine CoA-transferase CaiB-like acyl-CoA transferase